MSRRPRRVSELARRAGLDLDEALVALWDVGLDAADSGESIIAARDIALASKALGISAPDQLGAVNYWLERTGLERDQFTRRAAEVGVRISEDSRRLPKGGAKRLSRLFPAVVNQPQDVNPPPLEPLRWEIVGAEQTVRTLSESEVLEIHNLLEEDFADTDDPIFPPGVKSHNLLSSAVSRQDTGLGQIRKYPTREMCAGALFHSLCLNHAFHNGNKRTALVCLLAHLDENALVLTASQNDLFRFTLRTAQHGHVPRHADELADREVMEIARWIRVNTRPVEKGERPMKWVKLRQRLADFDCICEWATVGNRLNIYRTVPGGRVLGVRRRDRKLTTQVASSGDGSEADRNTIHKLRRDLELDDEHDVDSATFYAGSEVDSFIIEYRRILRRLAKL